MYYSCVAVTTADAYDNKAAVSKKNVSSSQNSLSTSSNATNKRTVIKIGGMHCAGCVNAIQGYVSGLPGVSKVEVNLANEKAALEYDQSKVKLDTIEKAIEEVGYKVVYEKIVLKIGGISDYLILVDAILPISLPQPYRLQL
jgi:copper ion binding protein